MRLRCPAARGREADQGARSWRCALLAAVSVLCNSLVSAQPAAARDGAAAQIEHGRYLTTAGNCYSCHTRPGRAAFAGGVAFVTPFGTIYSTNITPDAETGVGKWSAPDLQRAMHDGIGRDGSRLF